MADDKYKGLTESMAQELAAYEYEYFREDLPVPFCGLQIYPAKVRDYERFADATQCLTLDKNTTLDGIRMSNLAFLLEKTKDPKEGPHWAYRLGVLVEVCFHVKNGFKCPKCGKVYEYGSPEMKAISATSEGKVKELAMSQPELLASEDGLNRLREAAAPTCPSDGEKIVPTVTSRKDEAGKDEVVIDGHVITAKDFDRLRQIILFQNMPEYRDESWIDPNLKKDREERMRMERQKNNAHASIEEKVVCLSIWTHWSFAEIYDMPIRKFTMALSRVDDLLDYMIMKNSIMSGFREAPKGFSLKHWIYQPEEDMFGGGYKSLTEATTTRIK